MKNNKKIILSLFTIAGVLSFLFISPKEKRSTKIVKSKEVKNNTKSKDINSSTRSIASVPPVKRPSPSIKRVYTGSFSNLADITLTNKVNKNWKKLYKSNFLRMASVKKVKGLKIELKKSMVQVKNNIGRNLEHVVVSYIKPNGQPFSFEAIIDSETGHLVQTWNKTHYEFKKPFKIQGAKYLYKKES
jgi:hypothetical protein